MTNDVIKEAVAKQQSGDRKLLADNSVLGKAMTFNIGDQVYGIEIPVSYTHLTLPTN